MTARPDNSESNIRIDHSEKKKPPLKTDGGMVSSQVVASSGTTASYGRSGGGGKKTPGSSKAVEGKDGDFFGQADDPAGPTALDRDTIKSISKLIFERDHHVKGGEPHLVNHFASKPSSPYKPPSTASSPR
jgi:hypothetical protein